jgi:hypothetical protein
MVDGLKLRQKRFGKRMNSQLGSIDLQINEVSEIARNQNGKFQAVISHLKRAEK